MISRFDSCHTHFYGVRYAGWKGKNIIHFAASKKHLGLYPGGEATTAFAEDLKEYDVSKGTIRIPWSSPLPTDLISRIAKWCFEEYKQ